MKSNWCKGEEHVGCSVHGAMRATNGKTFKCDCPCHPPKKRPKRREDDDDREE